MGKIVIVVQGGNVQNVYGTNSDVEVILVDHDNINAGDPPASKLLFSDGTSAQEFIDDESSNVLF